MKRKISFSIGEYYHVYNRGNDKRIIYLDHKEYARFLILMYACNGVMPVHIKDQFPRGVASGELRDFDRGETLVDIGAYCLMPNHFHVLIKEKDEGGITKFLGKLSTGYSMYFNGKYERTGKLFEGPFKAVHITTDEHLKYLFSYIHLNPVKIIDPKWKEDGIADHDKARQYLNNYQYSSYLDYLGDDREENIIINKDVFPKYFENFKEFNSFIDEWLNPNNSLKATPL